MKTTIERQFREILDEHGALISKVCYMYASDADNYKDLYQEVLANIWQGLSRFRNECRISTWIYRVALNSCVSYFRTNRRHTQGTVPLDSLGGDVGEFFESNDAELREMYRLISMLNSFDKALIMLWLDGRQYDEIAEITGLSRPAVATKLHRIKARLVEMGNS